MLQDREKLYQAYHTLLSMVLGWALSLVINHYYGLKVSIVVSVFFAFLPALLIFLFDLNKKNAITYLIIAGIIPIVAFICWVRKFNPFIWLGEYVNWVLNFDGTEELLEARFANFTILLVGLAGVVLFFLLTSKQLLKVLLAISIFVSMIVLSVNKIEMEKTVICICVFYALTILVEGYGIIYGRKAGKKEKKESILYLAPICLMIAIFTVWFPSKAEPIQWTAVKNLYRNIKLELQDLSLTVNYYFGNVESREFFISLTGYSEESGKLSGRGGKLFKDKNVALKIDGTTTNRPVYLVGSVSDVYTGSSWEKSHTDSIPGEYDYKLDFMELSYALGRQDIEALENNRFVNKVDFKVKYDRIKTKTFFYPLKTSFCSMKSEKDPLMQEPSIIFEDPAGRGTSYDIVFYEMNLQGEAFQQMLRDSDDFSYNDPVNIDDASLEYLSKNILSRVNTKTFESRRDYFEILGERAKVIDKSYVNLPATIPDRVKDLALDITKDYDTKYDKLKAIEAYVNQYTYTLEPPQVPEGQDFVDYFLFDGKKGYCTSYASAMAVLGRCIGVPMRYVEGYVGKYKNKDKNGMYPVKNSQAHAWAEAYFKGVGWVPFEATAPFVESRYSVWADLSPSIPQVPDDYYMNLYSNMGQLQPYIPFPGKTVMPKQKRRSKMDEVTFGIILTLASVFVLISIVIIYYNTLRHRYHKQYRKADTSNKMYMMFLRILDLLNQEGFKLEEQETIQMLSDKVRDYYQFNKLIFRDIAKIFMRYRYAEEAITENELNKLIIFQDGLTKLRQEKQNKGKLWLHEFLFLMKSKNK